MKTRPVATFLLAVFVVAFAACGDDDDGGNGSSGIVEELEAVGVGRYLDIVPSRMERNDDWDEYFFDPAEESAICLRGAPYQVEVRRGTSNRVLLYLEGGGACWNAATCAPSGGNPPTAKVAATPFFGAGIFELDNPDNPFRDWNIVYAPYCDGSVFAGDNVVEYNGIRTYHHGLQNVSAAVALLRDQFPDPETIVVSGSSAGGYGTYSGYAVTRVAFPDTPVLVLNDSGPGVQNLDDPQAIADRRNNWLFEESIPPSCTNCTEQFSYLSEWSLERDPTLRVGVFSYLRDIVIRSFLVLTPTEYEALLREVTGDIHDNYPDRFKRFFVNGEGHTVLASPEFYTLAADGTTMDVWTAEFLADGSGWRDLVEVTNPFDGFASGMYSADDLWLCRPGLAEDQCEVNALDASVVQTDNSLEVEEHVPADDPPIDCFYIYPTVDLSLTPGNHTDFSDISLELDALLSQAARFNSVCRVFAPLYRQGTIGSFGSEQSEEIFALAYADVLDAFKHYMGQYNDGRNFVIMGHSQGTAMITRLLQEVIDNDPLLRERFVAGLLIGGGVAVPEGEVVGGTFDNLPLCTSDVQTGCIIAYRSYADGYPPANGSNVVGPEGMDTACTNPAALEGGRAYFRRGYFPLMINQPLFDVRADVDLPIETPFAAYDDLFTGECVKDEDDRSYLKVGFEPAAGDVRLNPIDFSHGVLAPAGLGTHIIDYNFAVGDLIELIRIKGLQD
jgi:hypothetical protein